MESEEPNIIQNYALLSANHILVARRAWLPTAPNVSNFLEIHHLSDEGVITLVATFHLPSLVPQVITCTLGVRHIRPQITSRNAGNPPATSSDTRSRPPITFQCANDRRVMQLTWSIFTRQLRRTYQMLFSCAVFATVMARLPNDKPVVLQWEDWGPANTRLWKDDYPVSMKLTSYDGQCITTSLFWKQGKSERVQRRQVTIVTPLTPNPLNDSPPDPDIHVGITPAYVIPSSVPTVVREESIFGDYTITTTLPCRCVTMLNYRASQHYKDRLICDDEHIAWQSVCYCGFSYPTTLIRFIMV